MKSAYVGPNRGLFANRISTFIEKRSLPNKAFLSLSHLLPQPPRLLVSLSQTPGLILAPLALSANQGQVIFVSPVVNKAIGDPIVKLLLKPNRLALVCSFLVLVVHQPLDVNRRCIWTCNCFSVSWKGENNWLGLASPCMRCCRYFGRSLLAVECVLAFLVCKCSWKPTIRYCVHQFFRPLRDFCPQVIWRLAPWFWQIQQCSTGSPNWR